MKIERIEGINDPRVMPVAAEGWAQLVADGLADHVALLAYSQNAIIATLDNGQTIGVLVYSDHHWEKGLFIDLGYVKPEHRRKGVYRLLWDDLVKIAQEKGRLRISSGTHVDNFLMQEVMKKLGRTLTFLTYRYNVPSVTTSSNEENPKVDVRP